VCVNNFYMFKLLKNTRENIVKLIIVKTIVIQKLKTYKIKRDSEMWNEYSKKYSKKQL